MNLATENTQLSKTLELHLSPDETSKLIEMLEANKDKWNHLAVVSDYNPNDKGKQFQRGKLTGLYVNGGELALSKLPPPSEI
jgi:hypothetical protein